VRGHRHRNAPIGLSLVTALRRNELELVRITIGAADPRHLTIGLQTRRQDDADIHAQARRAARDHDGPGVRVDTAGRHVSRERYPQAGSGADERVVRLRELGNHRLRSTCRKHKLRHFRADDIVAVRRQCHRSEHTDDRHHDHQLDQRETLLYAIHQAPVRRVEDATLNLPTDNDCGDLLTLNRNDAP
jgi:hypothetical protein